MTPAVDARPLRRKTIAILSASVAIAGAAALLHARGAPQAPAAAPGVCGAPSRVEVGGMVLELRAERCAVLRGRGQAHVAIELTAPAAAGTEREPVEMAIVIDRSHSMNAEQAIEDAKAAALRAIDALDERDAFSVVVYSTVAELSLPLGRATAAHKAEARERISMLRAAGGTNISAGLELGARSLEGACADCAHAEHVDRIVLISDGDPTEGTQTREGLAKLAARTAARGVSITSVGVGPDFDEQIMTDLAVAGRGNYYFVERASDLIGMFDRELASLADTVAVDAQLSLSAGAGVAIAEAYGYRVERQGGALTVPIADLRAGETRKVVVRLDVDAAGDVLQLLSAKLTWRAIGEHQGRIAERGLTVSVTDDASRLIVDPAAARPIQEALLAEELEKANQAYERGDRDQARQIVERATTGAASAVPAMRQEAEEVRKRVHHNFDRAEAGGKGAAIKDNRAMGYDLSR